ncbi:uncharacterized protein LOC116115816 [Pistacia vera]|uniref:uncharacterized protein LOC116115816 n=1 Tax=Pistacia vera TaxID=55513 RepID=UPI001263D879|nr:uncharacterized protein LOC116115816 [Pistacia vera]
MSSVTDSSSPLYIHPSDTPGSVLVSEQLTGMENYGIWSRAMIVSLRAKNKLGFVDGSCEKEIFNSIVYSSSAQQVWQDLQEQYHKFNGTRVFGIHREIVNMMQGTHSVAIYYNKLKTLWDELNSLAYSIVNQDESQKVLTGFNQNTEVTTTLYSQGNQRNQTQSSKYKGKKPYVECDYYHIAGHKKDNCYKLHGYPADFQFTKNKSGSKAKANQVHSSQESDSQTESTTDNNKGVSLSNVLTPQQYT